MAPVRRALVTASAAACHKQHRGALKATGTSQSGTAPGLPDRKTGGNPSQVFPAAAQRALYSNQKLAGQEALEGGYRS
ncbi:MAG: hypothetical protein ACRYGM_16930 [Janthinobacterium lividum]